MNVNYDNCCRQYHSLLINSVISYIPWHVTTMYQILEYIAATCDKLVLLCSSAVSVVDKLPFTVMTKFGVTVPALIKHQSACRG